MKRVVLWLHNLPDNLLDALIQEGIEVVALIQGKNPRVPSFSVHDLFVSSEKIQALPVCHAPACWIDDASFRIYQRCIARIGFHPLSHELDAISGGVSAITDLEDWARLQLSNGLRLLEGTAATEVWFCWTPHLGVDNMLSLAAKQSGRKVISFRQVPIAPKFTFRIETRDEIRNDIVNLETKPWLAEPKPQDLFYMERNRTRPILSGMAERLSFLMIAAMHGDWHAMVDRGYIAARKRKWWTPLAILDTLDPLTRPLALQRLVMRRRFGIRQREVERGALAELPENFVYFPLHLDPESNTAISGGRYFNQLDALCELSERLPAGWKIVVKENPMQTYLHRGSPFWQRIRAFSDVWFASIKTDSLHLIARSRLVATITGTAGYEAILQGKPCVYFGDAWYAGLPGTFAFDGELELQAVAKTEINKGLVAEALKQLLGRLPDGVVNPSFAGVTDDRNDPELLARTTARSMRAISDASF